MRVSAQTERELTAPPTGGQTSEVESRHLYEPRSRVCALAPYAAIQRAVTTPSSVSD